MGILDWFRSDITDPSAGQMEALAANPAQPMHLDQDVRAEIVPFAAYDFSGVSGFALATQQYQWQERFRRYDREGPGIVGQSVNIPSATSRLIDWTIQKQNPATLQWENADDDAVAMATLRLFRNEHTTLEGLMAQMIRTLDGPGEFIGIRHKVGSRHAYEIMSKHNISTVRNRPGYVEVRTRPDAPKGSRWWYEVPITQVVHIHNEDPDWPGLPTSPFQRVLPDLETYRLICRALGRNYKSRLAMNGVLWAQATQAAASWPDKFLEWSNQTVRDQDERDVRSITPFPLVTEQEPVWIRTHAPVEQIDIDTADYFLRAFCRGTDFPTKMLFDGPGTANHWGDYVINDYYADFVMTPRALKAADIVTHWVLRPWARILESWGGRDPERYRVFPDLTAVRTRTDNTDRILTLGNAGIADRQAQAEAAGLRPDQVVELPPGLSEAEWYAFLQGRNIKTINAAEPDMTAAAETTSPAPAAEDDIETDSDAGRGRNDGIGTGQAPERPDVDDLALAASLEGDDWSRDADLLLL